MRCELVLDVGESAPRFGLLPAALRRAPCEKRRLRLARAALARVERAR